MKLVFQADWEPVQRPNGLLVLDEVLIHPLCVLNGCVEERLQQTIYLS